MSFTTSLTIAPTSISISEARDKLTELTERAHYRFEQFRIARKDKPLARIVSDEYMQAIERLMEEDPVFAETLEIMMDDAAMDAITQGEQEINAGKLLPLDSILDH